MVAWGSIRRGYFALVASGTMVPPVLVEVLLTVLLYIACFAGVMRALPLVEDDPDNVLPVGGFGRYVEEVGDGLWSPSVKLVDERFVVKALTTSTSVVSGSLFLFWQNLRM